MTDKNFLVHVEVDDLNSPLESPEMEQERKVAIFDLLERNSFALVGKEGMSPPVGPYQLIVAMRDGRIFFSIRNREGELITEMQLSLTPFRDTIKTYFHICDLYYDAVKKHTRSRIETIDMTRRSIHDEGAELLRRRLESKVVLDKDTARRLFTLICVLQVKR